MSTKPKARAAKQRQMLALFAAELVRHARLGRDLYTAQIPSQGLVIFISSWVRRSSGLHHVSLTPAGNNWTISWGNSPVYLTAAARKKLQFGDHVDENRYFGTDRQEHSVQDAYLEGAICRTAKSYADWFHEPFAVTLSGAG